MTMLSTALSVAEPCVRENFRTFDEYVECNVKATQHYASQAQAQSTVAVPAQPLSTPPDTEVGVLERRERIREYSSRRDLEDALAEWEDREDRLRRATIGLGVATGFTVTVNTVLGLASQVLLKKMSDDLVKCIEGDVCSPDIDHAKQITNLGRASYVITAVTVVLGTSLIVSGVILGGHRSRRPSRSDRWTFKRGVLRF